MYAVIESGGKQHKVEKGMTLPVDLLKEEPGTKINFENVLLLSLIHISEPTRLRRSRMPSSA